MSFGVIDIGTNTVMLLVARKDAKGRMVVVDEQARVTRLGQGLILHHVFAAQAMQRTLEAIIEFKKRGEVLGVKAWKLVGTESLRLAINRDVFLEKVKVATDLEIKVITGLEEARLGFTGTVRDYPHSLTNDVLTIDIGGGSTEIVLGAYAPKNNKLVVEALVSLGAGSVRLHEEARLSDPPRDVEIDDLYQFIKSVVRDDLDEFYKKDKERLRNATIIATAGTVTTLAALDLGLKNFDPQKIHGHVLTSGALQQWVDRLRPLTTKERQSIPGMEPLRADVLFAGACWLHFLIRYFRQNQCLVSQRGLRYGVMWDFMENSRTADKGPRITDRKLMQNKSGTKAKDKKTSQGSKKPLSSAAVRNSDKNKAPKVKPNRTKKGKTS